MAAKQEVGRWENHCQVVSDRQPKPPTALNYREYRRDLRLSLGDSDVNPVAAANRYLQRLPLQRPLDEAKGDSSTGAVQPPGLIATGRATNGQRRRGFASKGIKAQRHLF